MSELDAIDRALLERLQADFALTARPFGELGRRMGVDEDEIVARVRRLKGQHLIRQISAIFDTRRLGYQSTLVAFHVRDERLEAVAAQLSAHPGVSHNYARPHYYNLWFTLAVPPGADLVSEIAHQAEQAGVSDWLNLPAVRMFKLRTHFKLDEGRTSLRAGDEGAERPSRRAFAPSDIPLVRALQQDLPIVARPFARAARQLGLSEDDLLDRARELHEAGIMRRFGAVLRHRQVGYSANGMACWVVPEEQIETAGQCAAALPQVSHCYQRPAYPPRWPYTLFTMVHGRTAKEVETVVARIAQQTGIGEVEVLYSTREFKKERIRYFAEDHPTTHRQGDVPEEET